MNANLRISVKGDHRNKNLNVLFVNLKIEADCLHCLVSELKVSLSSVPASLHQRPRYNP